MSKVVIAIVAVAVAVLAIYFLLLRKGSRPQAHVTITYKANSGGDGSNAVGAVAGAGAQVAGTAGCVAYGGPPQLCQYAGKFTGAVGKVVGTKVTDWVEGLF